MDFRRNDHDVSARFNTEPGLLDDGAAAPRERAR